MANRGSPGDFAGALNIGREQGLLRSAHGAGDPRGVAHPFPRRIKPQIIEVRDAQLGELTLPQPDWRSDPFEKGTGSIYYADWQVHRAFPFEPARAIVAKWLESFESFHLARRRRVSP